MDSDMGKAFDADFPLGPYPYTHISNQRPALDLSQSSLPSSLPQVQINQYAGAVREQPYSNLPLRPGLHIATSATAPNHGPRRSSASPVYHTARYSPYERPLSSHQTSPTHRATQSFTASSVSPKREHKSAMRSRQEANPPPLYTTNINQPAPPPWSISPAEHGPRFSSSNDPMSIDSLLNEIPTKPVTELYSIRVRQQPVDARKCGMGVKDRRHIDPPPVVQLFLNDPTMELRDIENKNVAAHCRLWNAETDTEERFTSDNHLQLYGNTCASLVIGPDEHNVTCAFFVFPDLSCRTSGKFRLRFQLTITPLDSPQGKEMPFMARCFSDVFKVCEPAGVNKFTGMSGSTPLTKALKEVGVSVKLRRKGTKNENAGRGEDEDEGEDDQVSVKQQITKRRKRGGKK